MELGVCTGPPSAERAARLASAGCEYYEPSVAGAVMVAGRDAFTAGIGEWARGGLAPRSANVLLPGDLAVVGEERDDERDEHAGRPCPGNVRPEILDGKRAGISGEPGEELRRMLRDETGGGIEDAGCNVDRLFVEP